MLLERDQQLAELSTFAGESASLGGGVVLIGGEAGIGKTTLVRAFTAEREHVLTGACEPLTTPRPLQPLHDIAHQAAGRLATLMASDVTRHERFTALLEVLAEAPTIAVIEDVHWADEATLDLLVFLGRRLPDTASVLALTFREGTPDAPPRLTEVLGHLAAGGRSLRLALPPLSLDAVAQLAEGLSVEAGRVHEATAGNPFFVTEVLASEGAEVPVSVRDAVLGRAAGLDERARAVLEAAAVVPDRVELPLLYAVSGADSSALEQCERVGLLDVAPRFATYRHELARNAVLDSLPAVRRQQLHQSVVTHLLTQSGHHEARIAHHADLAGDSSTVLIHAVAAAEQAARLGSHREAAAQVDRALAHLDVAEPAAAAEVLGLATELFQTTGRIDDALEVSTRAIELLRELDHPDLALQLARHSRVLWVLTRGAESRAAVDEAVELVTRMPGTRSEVRVLGTASALYMLAREIPLSLETGRRAVALARERSDLQGLVRALNAVGTSSWFSEPDDAEPLLVESLETARRLRDDVGIAQALVNLGSGAGEVRRYDVARRWLEECRDFCLARDHDHTGDYAVSWLARINLEQGDWDQALDQAERLLARADQISRIGGLTVSGRVRVRRGLPGGPALLDEAWESALNTRHLQRLWPVAAGRAEAAWFAGRPEQVPGLVAETFDLAVTLQHPWAIGELGWWLARAGAPREATGAAAPYAAMLAGRWSEAADLWDQLGVPWEAALCRSETDDPGALADASTALHRLGARADAARTAQRMRQLGLAAVGSPRRTTAANPAGLTDRELEVARLMSQGRTNAEIAEALFISTKTAAHHVSAILAKVGARNRREAAVTVSAWAAR